MNFYWYIIPGTTEKLFWRIYENFRGRGMVRDRVRVRGRVGVGL